MAMVAPRLFAFVVARKVIPATTAPSHPCSVLTATPIIYRNFARRSLRLRVSGVRSLVPLNGSPKLSAMPPRPMWLLRLLNPLQRLRLWWLVLLAVRPSTRCNLRLMRWLHLPRPRTCRKRQCNRLINSRPKRPLLNLINSRPLTRMLRHFGPLVLAIALCPVARATLSRAQSPRACQYSRLRAPR